MAWFNIIAILLYKTTLLALKDYEKQRKAGKDPVFNPEDRCQMPIFGIR
jgi:AGCS family alanine or glycine:cation symporter